jgi:lipopolysaccharide/colanic/teichoic acid biosynthesis glycosyltransferase
MRGLSSPPCAVSNNQLSWHVQEEGVFRQMRRLGDIVITCLLLAITSPLMLIVAVAIKLEGGGPVLDRQSCIGCSGRRFQMLKFRTAMHDPKHATAPWARQTTQIGEFLRYTRIEDLPQLINVLRGEMSIIDRDARSPSFLD